MCYVNTTGQSMYMGLHWVYGHRMEKTSVNMWIMFRLIDSIAGVWVGIIPPSAEKHLDLSDIHFEVNTLHLIAYLVLFVYTFG